MKTFSFHFQYSFLLLIIGNFLSCSLHSPPTQTTSDQIFIPKGSVHLGSDSKVTDLRPIADVHTLDLGDRSRVTDLEPIADVHTLHLGYRSIVTNIQCLKVVNAIK